LGSRNSRLAHSGTYGGLHDCDYGDLARWYDEVTGQ